MAPIISVAIIPINFNINSGSKDKNNYPQNKLCSCRYQVCRFQYQVQRREKSCQKVGKCLPEIKKEISRKGSPKSAEKVLQINQEKIRNQAVNEKAHPPNLSGGWAFVINWDSQQGLLSMSVGDESCVRKG